MVILGKELANKIKLDIKNKINSIIESGNRKPCLVTILVGDNPASKVYVTNKEKACKEVGILPIVERYDESITEERLLNIIDMYNNNKYVDGILVQLPLPKHINSERVLNAIDPKKDVDGFHPENVANLWLKKDCIVPCTPKGIIKLIDSTKVDLCGKNVVVLGRSNIVGLPVAKLCLDRNATVTICHSKTANLTEITRQADVLIVAIGKPKFVTSEMIGEDTIVIDVGINRVDGKLCGDVDFDYVSKYANAITPVPGGVGPMTIACLMENTVECFLKQQ